MSGGLASALEIAARIIRDNDLDKAKRLLAERREELLAAIAREDNVYLRFMECGYAHAISALQEVGAVKGAIERGEALLTPFAPGRHVIPEPEIAWLRSDTGNGGMKR